MPIFGKPPRRGVAYDVPVYLVSQAVPTAFQSNPTLATGDVKISKDFGAFNNITTLPTVPNTDETVKLSLSATEMAAHTVVVKFYDVAGDEWASQAIIIQTEPGAFVEASVNDGAPTTTGFVTDLTETDDDAYNNAFLLFVTGTNTGQSQMITDYNGTTKAVTTNAFTSAPANGDKFIIVGKKGT